MTDTRTTNHPAASASLGVPLDRPEASGDVRIEQLARVSLRPMANPLPLGLLGLGVASALITALQLKWIAATNTHQVALLLLIFAAPLQAVSSMLSFYIRDVVMATGLGLLSVSWASSGALLLSGPPGSRSQTFGVLAIAVAAALAVPAIGVSFAKPIASVVILVAAIRFASTGIYQLSGVGNWQTTSGIIGVVLMCTTFYASLAFVLEDVRHHPVLPIKRRGTSGIAMSGSLGRQLESLATEAGVRQES